MAKRPILLIQLRRLGDLILTFPLLESLQKKFSAHPLLFAAEETFYKELSPLLPNVQFFPASALPSLSQTKYEMLINFESRLEAARCAAKAEADLKIGFQIDENGAQSISGFWQLYRSSLTQNNRHNTFHWADLNRLDLFWPLEPILPAKKVQLKSGRIGLFIGASEAAKKPDVNFWASLVRLLLAKGFRPLLLGGTAEISAGEEIAKRTKLEKANFCGKTSLIQLTKLIESLDLLITPDTGPMHLADWLKVPVFNLSLGNVNAHETGPMRPGQLIMRANMSCVGCWQCSRAKTYCHSAFNPSLVARTAQAFLNGEMSALLSEASPFPSVELLISTRDANGLYALKSLTKHKEHSAREALDRFWHTAFLYFNGKTDYKRLQTLAENLNTLSPKLALNIRKNAMRLLTSISAFAKGKKNLPENLWKNFPAHSRLFAGFLEMSLQNGSFAPKALSQALEKSALIGELFPEKN